MAISKIQYGDLLAVRSHGLSQGIVRWWTTGVVDHVACCINDSQVVDARPFTGVQRRSIENALDKHQWVLLRLKPQYSYMLSSETEESSKTWLLNQAGKGYDWCGLAGFPLGKDVDDPNRWYCSEIGFAWAKSRGVLLMERTPGGLVSPQDILGCPLLGVVDASSEIRF